MSLTAPFVTAAPLDTGEPRGRRTFVFVLSLTGIMVALQQTLVIPLVPQLPTLLDVTAADASWAITATLLTAAIATPTMGRLADMYGKRRMLLLCLGSVIAGSVVAAVTSSLAGLLLGRALQGLGLGVIPLGISLMRDHLPIRLLARGTARMSASLGIGGAFGLPLGAFIAEHGSFHTVFWVSGTMAAVVTLLVVRFVPESPAPGGRFDAVGAVGLSLSLLALLLALSKGGGWGWGSPLTLGLFGGSLVLLLLWGRWELHTAQPLVDLRVSRRRQVLLTNLTSPLFGFGVLTSSLIFPQLVQLPAASGFGLGQTLMVAGLIQTPSGVMMLLVSPLSARLTERAGARTSLVAGALVTGLGYLFAAVWHSELWHIAVAVSVVSAGIGLAYGAIPALIMADVPLGQTAAANAANNLARAFGTSVAGATAGMVLAGMTTTVGGTVYPSEAGFVLVLVIAAVGSAIAVGVGAFLPRRRGADAHAAH